MSNNPTSATRPPHIGYVLRHYPRFPETFVVNEILAYECGGVKVDTFALGPVEDTYPQDGISRVRIPVARLERKHYEPETVWLLIQTASERLPDFTEKLARAKYTVYKLTQSISVAPEVQNRGIQYLHAHFGMQAATVAHLAADFTGITYTFTAHAKDIYFQYAEPIHLDMKIRNASATVTILDYNLTYLQQRYGKDAEEAVRIYNDMSLSKFPYNEFTSRRRHILAVGRLAPKKGLSVLLGALSLLRKQNIRMHCTSVGDGPLYEDLSARTEALDTTDIVMMVGPMLQPGIIRLMKNGNMVMTPCVISDGGDRDGLSTVLLEPMALNTSVISTQVAGIPEPIVDDETGLCVPSENPQASAEAMARLLNNHDICQTFSYNGHALVEREYDGDRNATKLCQVLDNVIDSRPAVQTEGEPMRTVYICVDPGIPVFDTKGAFIHVQGVAKAMLSRDSDITLFAQRLGGDVPGTLKNVPIRKLETLPKGSVEIRAHVALAANARVGAMLEAEGPFDMVYERYSLWSSAGMDFVRGHNCVEILEVSTPPIEEQKRHRELPLEDEARRVAESIFAAADAMIVVSPGVKQRLETLEKARDRAHVVANGVALDRFTSTAEKNVRRL